MAILPIIGGINMAIGAYNTIRAGRARKRITDQMEPLLKLVRQTAEGGGPMIEAATSGAIGAGEISAQIAQRAALAGGSQNRGLALTLANANRIGGQRNAAIAKGTLQSQALSSPIPGQIGGQLLNLRQGQMQSGATGIGLGLEKFLSMFGDGGGGVSPVPAGGPIPIPNAQFNPNITLPGMGGARNQVQGRWRIPYGRGR